MPKIPKNERKNLLDCWDRKNSEYWKKRSTEFLLKTYCEDLGEVDLESITRDIGPVSAKIAVKKKWAWEKYLGWDSLA
jgi:hypothetical protein